MTPPVSNVREFVRDLAAICSEGRSIDSGELQYLMVRYGLLTTTTMVEPCGMDCFCTRAYGEEAFPLTCYKLAAEMIG